jgi:hypothetical protein
MRLLFSKEGGGSCAILSLSLVRLIKYSRVRVGKHLSNSFSVKNVLKRDNLSPLF